MPATTRSADQPLGTYATDIAVSTPLSREREDALGQRIRQGDLEARNKLVQANLRFVVEVARKYQNQGLPLADLVSAGNLGLITAAERFDSSKGFKFITYAVWWVRQAINQALGDHSRTVRLPPNKITQLREIKRVSNSFVQKGEPAPDFEQIARQMQVPPEEIEDTLSSAHTALSMEEHLDENGLSLTDLLADPDQPPPDTPALRRATREAIDGALQNLDPREAFILRLYYGLDGEKPLYLEEIGQQLQLTRERVRQLKERALNKLRHPQRGQALRSLIEEN